METSYLIFVIFGIALGFLVVYAKRINGSDSMGLRIPDREFPYQWRQILEPRIKFYRRFNREERKRYALKAHFFLLHLRIIGV